MHSASNHLPLRALLLRVLLGTALLLLIPAVAMQFTREVRWGPGDFLAAGGLLNGAGVAIVLVRRSASTTLRRATLTLLIALAFLLAWAELAVGIFR